MFNWAFLKIGKEKLFSISCVNTLHVEKLKHDICKSKNITCITPPL
jgi:hypothetical protein